jgi:DeoR/GlpR family transcriptional regulator of sugar metabolism
MLTDERRAQLMAILARDGRIVAQDAARALHLSEDTIRRDLRLLAADGHLLRVHGGALPLSPTHKPLVDRQKVRPVEKDGLARAAVGLIRPGQIVIIDGGTTHAALVRALPRDWAGTIVTHSPTIATGLVDHAKAEVVLIGGRLYPHSMVALGAVTLAAYGRLRADIAFVGVTGVAPDTGLTTGNAEEAEIKAALISAAAETHVLATSDKIGAASPWRIAPLTDVTGLISVGPRPAWLPAGVGHITG